MKVGDGGSSEIYLREIGGEVLKKFTVNGGNRKKFFDIA